MKKIINVNTLISFLGLLGFQYFINGSSFRNSSLIYLFEVLYTFVFLNGIVLDALKEWREKKRFVWKEKAFRYHCYTVLLAILVAWSLTFFRFRIG